MTSFTLTVTSGWPVLLVAGVICASVFGQVTVNETMTARYVAPALRAKLYSIRFSVGRFTTEEEVDFAVSLLTRKVGKLREMSPLWEMVKDGVDLDTVQWAAH